MASTNPNHNGNGTPSAPACPSVSDVGEVDEAALAARLADLEAERAGSEDAITAAARIGDEAAVLQLLVRQRVLPHQIAGARADLLRHRIAAGEREDTDLAARVAVAHQASQDAHAAIGAAQATVRDRQRAFREAQWGHQVVAQERERLAARLDGFRAELATLTTLPPAPPAQQVRPPGGFIPMADYTGPTRRPETPPVPPPA